MRRSLVLLAILAIVGVLLFLDYSDHAAVAQQPTEEFQIVDLVDLDVLYENLSSSAVSDEVEDHFLANRPCRHLAQSTTYSNGNERDYNLQMAFKGSSTRYVLDWTYEKDSSSGTDPAIPPDTQGALSESTPTHGPNQVRIGSQLEFDFLLVILEDPPAMIGGQLDTKDLVDLWTEADGNTYYVFLRFEDANEQLTTKRCWSQYSNGDFGTINTD